MEIQDGVPFSVDEVSAEWLTESFNKSGLLNNGTVTDCKIKVLGEQVGLNGEVAMVTLTYSEPDGLLPNNLILKIPTASKNRILGQTMGLYEKEIRFYRDLQEKLCIRTPKHFYSALDAADDSDVILERLEGMNRLPIFVIRVLMALASWLVAATPRNYVLLIEDLSKYRMGDQIAGCSDEDVSSIITTMSRLHAQHWQSEDLGTMTWIAPFATLSRIMQMRFLQTVQDYIKKESVNLSSRQTDMLRWLRENGIEITEALAEASPTLLHGDFRLDNICFDDELDEVILFDWQTMQAGPGGSDLAYFISASIPLDTEEDKIDAHLIQYHRELTEQGIEVSADHLRWQYDMGLLCILHRLLPTVHPDLMDLEAERTLPLLEAWIERIFKRLEIVSYPSILTRRESTRG